jgi:murein DD-endopeptidase MepM/ murein hydrolase activator NlpD
MKQKDSIDLKFPFKDGHFLIAEGGDGKASFFSNYHYLYWKSKIKGYATMRFATDIVKLDTRGFSKKGVVPVENDLFYIYDEPVYSPIDGEVIQVRDEYDDHSAHSGKYPSGLGNMVVIKKDDYYVLLGHLKKNKTVVVEGQRIKAGELVGNIGMTGYTPRPHLHMHVSRSATGDFWEGRGIPVTFYGKLPYKNKLFKV